MNILKIFQIFKKKCNWCTGEEKNTVHFNNPTNGDDIAIQIDGKEIVIAFNDSRIGGIDIKYCPICRRKVNKARCLDNVSM